jgi:hypothetical protein
MAYQTFRDAFNNGAREVSAMAWNGSNGIYADQPGYVPYTSWRNTPAEDAMRDFLVSHADVPVGARLWTFGTPVHVDADGWTAERGTLAPGAGFVTLQPDSREVTLLSPPDQVIRPQRLAQLVLRFDGNAKPSRTTVEAQEQPAGPWRRVGTTSGAEVALKWPASWNNARTIVTRLRVTIGFPGDAGGLKLARLLLYPASPTTRASP